MERMGQGIHFEARKKNCKWILSSLRPDLRLDWQKKKDELIRVRKRRHFPVVDYN